MDQLDQLSHTVGFSVEQNLRRVLEFASRFPGSKYVGQYILRSHQNDPARTIFEILLAIFAVHYFFKNKQSYYKRDQIRLTEAEIDELIAEWEPEPLVGPISAEKRRLLSEIPVITSEELVRVTTADTGNRTLLNLSSPDVYNISQDPEFKALAAEKIKRYGVGSCGPAGFYGNQDVHIECEQEIAKFIDTESAILYSQGVSTAPSVIPCFAKRGDVLVVDDAVSLALQQGIELSRAKVLFYKHNDMDHLEQQLRKVVKMHTQRKVLPRRYIVTEGLFETTGNSPDLSRIIQLKNTYKFRLILDESWSLGVLGKSGRGLVEEQNVNRKDVDVTIASMATAVGTYGGFCAGSRALVEHQRIVSLAYTFSATEPPYLAACTSLMMEKLGSGKWDAKIAGLKQKAVTFNKELEKCANIDLISREDSPMIIFRVNNGREDADDEAASRLLHAVVMAARDNGLLLSRLAQIVEFETFGPVNAIKVFLPEELTMKEVVQTAQTLVRSVKEGVKQAA